MQRRIAEASDRKDPVIADQERGSDSKGKKVASRKRRATRLVNSDNPSRPPEGLPAWAAQTYGIALILGDVFLGRRLVESFDAFSDQGLTGLLDPFAGLMLSGLVGWWVVLLLMRRTWASEPVRPISAGVAVTVIVMAFVTAVLFAAGIGALVPDLSLVHEDSTNVAGALLIAFLLLALVAVQWWRLQMFDPEAQEPPIETGANLSLERQPERESSERGAEDQPRARPHPARPVPPALRLAAGMLLLPAGWALMAPADFSVQQAQSGIELNWSGTFERFAAAALFSLFSAAFGMFMAYGPRALAARILGEGLSGARFFAGLWLAHCVRLCVALLGV